MARRREGRGPRRGRAAGGLAARANWPVRSEAVMDNVNGIRVKTGLLLSANKAQFGG